MGKKFKPPKAAVTESYGVRTRTKEEKEQKFVEGIMLGLGKRAAAIAAGYAEKSAGPTATELLDRPSVKLQLEAFYKRDEAEVMSAREVLRERLFRMATCNAAAEVFTADWGLVPKEDLPPEVLSLIITARTWDSPEQGSGASVKFVNPLDPIKDYLKLFPAPPPAAATLEDAAEEVEMELDELLDRLYEDESDEDWEDEEDDEGSSSDGPTKT